MRLLWEARYPYGATMIAGTSCTLAVHSFTTTTATAMMTRCHRLVARGCTGRLDARTICCPPATMLLARAQRVSTKFCAYKTLGLGVRRGSCSCYYFDCTFGICRNAGVSGKGARQGRRGWCAINEPFQHSSLSMYAASQELTT